MIYIFFILIVTTLIAFLGEKKTINARYNNKGSDSQFIRYRVRSYAFVIIVIIFIVFVGLRSSFNDTAAYIRGFDELSTGWEVLEEWNWSLGSNPGFNLTNTLIKTFISENAQVMIFTWSLVTIVLFFKFYRRWSKRFWLTVFFYSASGLLLFSMAALKQVIAMSIGLYGITCLLKNQRIAFVIFILIGSTIHTYLLLYLVAFFLMDRVWSIRMLLIVLGAILSGVFIDSFIGLAYKATALVGADYERSNALSGEGLNIFRFIVYCVPPVLTWIYRKKINKSGDVALILFSNLMLVGWSFMFIALFISANMFARMGMYFDPFAHLTLTALLVCIISKKIRV